MSEEKIALTDKDFVLVKEYAERMGMTLGEALKMAYKEGVKDRLQDDKEGSVQPLKRP